MNEIILFHISKYLTYWHSLNIESDSELADISCLHGHLWTRVVCGITHHIVINGGCFLRHTGS